MSHAPTSPSTHLQRLSAQPANGSAVAPAVPAAQLPGPAVPSSHHLASQRSLPRLSRPPTSGGGPLSSHPADESPMPEKLVPGAFPQDKERTATAPADMNTSENATMSTDSARHTSESARPPTSPNTQSSPGRERPSGVRRLFSLNSLRQSFSSSRTSFSTRPSSSYGDWRNQGRPQTPSGRSMLSNAPSAMEAPPSRPSDSPVTLRKRQSSSWFKRKSGFFNVNEDGELEVVDHDRAHDPKRFKTMHTLPMLPEIGTLGGGELNEGSLGWDEEAFKS